MAGCAEPLDKNPPTNMARVGFNRIKYNQEVNTLTVGISVESKADIAGVQIELSPADSTIQVYKATPVSMAAQMPFLANSQQNPFVFGFVDINGKEVIKAGKGDIAQFTVTVPEGYKGSEPVNIDNIVFADTKGRVMRLQVDANIMGEPIPRYFDLSQNYPNPFNPNTKIDYALPKPADVKLTIYNVLGQTVKVLVDEHQEAGYYTIIWDSKDKNGSEVATGVYFYHLEAGEFAKSKKMLLLK